MTEDDEDGEMMKRGKLRWLIVSRVRIREEKEDGERR